MLERNTDRWPPVHNPPWIKPVTWACALTRDQTRSSLGARQHPGTQPRPGQPAGVLVQRGCRFRKGCSVHSAPSQGCPAPPWQPCLGPCSPPRGHRACQGLGFTRAEGRGLGQASLRSASHSSYSGSPPSAREALHSGHQPPLRGACSSSSQRYPDSKT